MGVYLLLAYLYLKWNNVNMLQLKIKTYNDFLCFLCRM